MTVSLLAFSIRLLVALLLGSVIGLERQWRQRMAGTRTNALVSAGASAFVMAGFLIMNDPQAPGRMASYVISGVGFLGAGVIFKDSGTVRGLNTAATIWCSAAIGVLCGLGALPYGLLGAMAVLLSNIVLRPLSYRLYPALPNASSSESFYEMNLICRAADESHVRALLMASISQAGIVLQSLQSEDIEGSDRSSIRAGVSTIGSNHELLEKIVARLSLEPGITGLSWSATPSPIE